jgi:hypothetical protein
MKKLSLLFGLLFFLASCSENNLVTPNPDSGEGVHSSVGLTVAPMEGDASTRATNLTTVEEDQITRLWVLQFDDADNGGTGKLLKKYYTTVSDKSKIDVVLLPNLDGVKSNIYFVANVGNTDLSDFNGDEAAFQTAVQKVTSELGFVMSGQDVDQTQKCLPMSGSLLHQTVTAAGITGGISISLTRMLARIDFRYSIGTLAAGKFSLQSIRACNVPNVMSYVAPSTATYPVSMSAASVLSFGTSATTEGVIIPASDPDPAMKQLTYYVPENMRGDGTNTSGLDKLKGGIPFATYFELYGAGINDFAGEKYTFKLYPGSDTKNNYDIKRNTKYILTANLTNLSLSDRRITKVGSNCYIVAPGGSVDIPISRANESLLDIQIPDVYNSGCTASVYWESGTTAGGVVTLSNTTCDGGAFKVTGAGTGNAVVCIKNGAGKILWSWHIWVSSVDFKSANTTTFANGSTVSYTWMDRNLGALDVPGAGTSYATTSGMLYQWGRKDPFLPATVGQGSIIATTGALPIVSSAAITDSYTKLTGVPLTLVNKGDSYLRYGTLGTSGSLTYANALSYSVQSPMLFLVNWAGSTASGAASATMGIDSWGGEFGQNKSVYDPCPAGWRVPSGKASTGFASPWAGMPAPKVTPTLNTDAKWNVATNNNYANWVGSSKPLSGSYPVAGYRNGGDGKFTLVGTAGCYWSSAAIGATGYCLYFYSDFANPASSSYGRGSGFSVRCVKE